MTALQARDLLEAPTNCPTDMLDQLNAQDSLHENTRLAAYFRYLDRQQSGVRGDELGDWLNAETEVAAAAVPRTPETVTPTSDDLTKLRGVGKVLAKRLAEAGITSFATIAGWTTAEAEEIDAPEASWSH